MILHEFFKENPKIALAFSGGVDSAYLLWAAIHEKADVCAYFVNSPFQPRSEMDDAVRLAKELQAKIRILTLDILGEDTIRLNPPDRCYHCKKAMVSVIMKEAVKDGYSVLMDGTNFSDDPADRPGERALKELSVRSPLRECGLDKADIRRLSREAGLFIWDKPSYACLATRITRCVPITAELLDKTEKAEVYLSGLGFSDFRVRLYNSAARIQIKESQFDILIRNRKNILQELEKYYSDVLVDLEVRGE